MNKYPTNSRCCLPAPSSAFTIERERMLYVIYLLTSFITPPEYLTLFIKHRYGTLCSSSIFARKDVVGVSPFP